MTIGIDLSSLQGAHRMRGIGYTLLNIMNNISEGDRKKHSFVFYAYKHSKSPLDLLNLEGMNYEVRPLRNRRRIHKELPGRLNLFVSALNQLIELKDLHFGDSRIKDLRGVDFFLQTDQSERLPRRKWGMKRGLIVYDIIPYVIEWEYLWSYGTARKRGYSRKAALRVYARRWLYAHKIKVNSRRADTLISISTHTKNDFTKYLGIKAKKIMVVPLGINLPSRHSSNDIALKHYVKTSWGYVSRAFTFGGDTPFVLYVGGADRRRRVDDLVAAFNTLRAQGHEFKLVLAGDSMQGPDNIATEEIQYALKASSYQDDIVFMGFVDDKTRDWLYNHAHAFVFPSKYEGFGLPVLEAMSYGTPVISYDNAATREVAADKPTYAANMLELADAIKGHLGSPTKAQRADNVAQAKRWSWAKTCSGIFETISGKA
jgi:glycosyltransferase involved in cell wall biosynthesis